MADILARLLGKSFPSDPLLSPAASPQAPGNLNVGATTECVPSTPAPPTSSDNSSSSSNGPKSPLPAPTEQGESSNVITLPLPSDSAELVFPVTSSAAAEVTDAAVLEEEAGVRDIERCVDEIVTVLEKRLLEDTETFVLSTTNAGGEHAARQQFPLPDNLSRASSPAPPTSSASPCATVVPPLAFTQLPAKISVDAASCAPVGRPRESPRSPVHCPSAPAGCASSVSPRKRSSPTNSSQSSQPPSPAEAGVEPSSPGEEREVEGVDAAASALGHSESPWAGSTAAVESQADDAQRASLLVTETPLVSVSVVEDDLLVGNEDLPGEGGSPPGAAAQQDRSEDTALLSAYTHGSPSSPSEGRFTEPTPLGAIGSSYLSSSGGSGSSTPSPRIGVAVVSPPTSCTRTAPSDASLSGFPVLSAAPSAEPVSSALSSPLTSPSCSSPVSLLAVHAAGSPPRTPAARGHSPRAAQGCNHDHDLLRERAPLTEASSAEDINNYHWFLREMDQHPGPNSRAVVVAFFDRVKEVWGAAYAQAMESRAALLQAAQTDQQLYKAGAAEYDINQRIQQAQV